MKSEQVIFFHVKSGRLPAPSASESEIVRVQHGETTWLRGADESEEQFIERAQHEALAAIAARPLIMFGHSRVNA